MQGIKSVMINTTKNELKRRGKSKLLSDVEQKNSRSGSQGKVADQEISPRSIPMQGIKSVLINAAENEFKRRGLPKLLSDLEQKSQGQGHREMSQFRRSHQGLFPCKVSSLY